MTSFAKPETQARRAVSRNLALRVGRRNPHGDHGRVHGLGTARNYEQALRLAARWDRVNGGPGIANWTQDRALKYLTTRAEIVGQKTLDMDRQSLAILPGVDKLPVLKSSANHPRLAVTSRAYTAAQVATISAAQTPHNSLATEIAYAAGLRAHELLTLARSGEQSPSPHRNWTSDRFAGRAGVVYTVGGKGGLFRHVLLPSGLAARLEAARLDQPRLVRDRKIDYVQHYDVGGGNAWSKSFGQASVRELGWSRGAHGLRHSYAQERLDELQGLGHEYPAALAIVSQEMGHFRPEITETYLR